ncbi:hypothetical protein ACLVWQ_17485 (plasmid) [Streptomyces sp. CWNU-52B]|uniref:hypothetical protein n=1 Tax=unclassified Streptomyces TaxID=2593676 RepID=UPI0039C1D79B
MTEPTHSPLASTDEVVKTVRWCHWHDDAVTDAVLIDAVEKASGPPYPLYACGRCRERNNLVPLANQPR